MWSSWWSGAALCTWALVLGCGEDSGGDDGGSAGSSASAGASGMQTGLPPGTRAVVSLEPPRPGECMSGADCSGGGPGTACATVAGGYRVCTFQTPVATAATNPPGACDQTRACAMGSCYPVLTFPTGQCGGGGARNVNRCLADECGADADCPNGGVCGPPGLTVQEGYSGGAVRQCLKAACKSSAECAARAGGMCALVQTGCAPEANGTQTFLPAQLACVYPNGCTSQSDCPRDPASVCRVINGVGVCIARM